MTRPRTFALLLAALLSGAAYAQSPTDGHIAGKSYVNTYLRIAYTWPATLQPKVQPPQPASSSPGAYAFPLFIATQGDQPYGVVVVAEKLNVAGPHSTGLHSSADYIERIKSSLHPGPVISNFSSSRKKGFQGFTFDQLDYTQNGKPAALLATQVGEYIVIFKCSAQSATDMARMQSSALALRKLP